LAGILSGGMTQARARRSGTRIIAAVIDRYFQIKSIYQPRRWLWLVFSVHAMISLIKWPCTSVKRRSIPLFRNVSFL
jgi:hypothetical protein